MATIDPLKVLAELTPERIRERLQELDREVRALRILLRSALARQHAETRRTSPKEVDHAS